MAKTYVPTLRSVVEFGYRYASRWQPKLEAGLTTEQFACLTTWLAATVELLACLPPKNIQP